MFPLIGLKYTILVICLKIANFAMLSHASYPNYINYLSMPLFGELSSKIKIQYWSITCIINYS
jgi:hypothetical protein